MNDYSDDEVVFPPPIGKAEDAEERAKKVAARRRLEDFLEEMRKQADPLEQDHE